MTATTPILTTPGDMLANLPGILGFYPEESVVFAAFASTTGNNRFRLGPVARVDLPAVEGFGECAESEDSDGLDVLSEALHENGHDLVFAYVITRNSDEHYLEQIADRLFRSAETLGIHSCWIARRILTGEPYCMVFGPEREESDRPDVWESGRIPSVSSAVATQTMVRNNELPELSREDAYRYFDRDTASSPSADAAEAQKAAEDRSSTYALRMATGKIVVREILEEFDCLLDQSATGVALQSSLLTETAALIDDIQLRDLVTASVAYRPREALPLMLSVARLFDGRIRSNALCLYALAALSLELGMRATPALIAALETTPNHGLASLMLQACSAGQFSTIITACTSGSELVREQCDG